MEEEQAQENDASTTEENITAADASDSALQEEQPDAALEDQEAQTLEPQSEDIEDTPVGEAFEPENPDVAQVQTEGDEEEVEDDEDMIDNEMEPMPNPIIEEAPEEAPKEAPEEAPEEEPVETPDEAPEEAPQEVPQEGLEEAAESIGTFKCLFFHAFPFSRLFHALELVILVGPMPRSTAWAPSLHCVIRSATGQQNETDSALPYHHVYMHLVELSLPHACKHFCRESRYAPVARA